MKSDTSVQSQRLPKDEARLLLDQLPDNASLDDMQRYAVPHLRSPEDQSWAAGCSGRSYYIGGGVRETDGAVARTVSWTETALRDLDEVAQFIARDSKFYAAVVVREAKAAAGSLRTLSERGRTVPEAADPDGS